VNPKFLSKLRAAGGVVKIKKQKRGRPTTGALRYNGTDMKWLWAMVTIDKQDAADLTATAVEEEANETTIVTWLIERFLRAQSERVVFPGGLGSESKTNCQKFKPGGANGKVYMPVGLKEELANDLQWLKEKSTELAGMTDYQVLSYVLKRTLADARMGIIPAVNHPQPIQAVEPEPIRPVATQKPKSEYVPRPEPIIATPTPADVPRPAVPATNTATYRRGQAMDDVLKTTVNR